MEWRKAEEAPDDGQRVLCIYPGIYYATTATHVIDGGGYSHFVLDGSGSCPAKFWMPLPEPPE